MIRRYSEEIIYESRFFVQIARASLQVSSVITDWENTRKNLRARTISRMHDVIN